MADLGSRYLSASAGSGKTYALSMRFCALVMAGVPPEAICALTFTRAATREIFAAVIERFLDGDVTVRPDGLSAEAALAKILEALPRLQIATIDAFSARIAKLFAYELGLDPEFALYDAGNGPEAQAMLHETVRRALRVTPKASAEELLDRFDLSRLGGGAATRLSERLTKAVGDYGAILREHPEGWGDTSRLGPLPACLDSREARLGRLATLRDVPTATVKPGHANAYRAWLDSLAMDIDSVREQKTRWKDSTLERLANARQGTFTFRNKTLDLGSTGTAAARDLWDDLLGRDLAQTAEHTRRLRTAVEALNVAADELADETALLTFDTLTRTLAERLGGRLSTIDPDALYVAYRMDTAIRHLMIDEFQDTSVTQWRVLGSLAAELTAEADGTFFYVGDVKQSIYGWRGGDATLFGDPTRVPDIPAGPPLLESYRSSPDLIALINRVFTLTESDIAAAEPWQRDAYDAWRKGWQDHVAHRRDAGLTQVFALEGKNREDWLTAAADTVAARWRALRGKSLRLALLAFRNKDLEELLPLLRTRGVACAIDGKQQVGELPMGRLVCGLLHWLADPRATLWGEIARRIGIVRGDDTATLAHWTRQIAEGGYVAWLDALFQGPAREALAAQDREALETMRLGLSTVDARGQATPAAARAALQALVIPCAADSDTLSLMTVHHSKGLTYDVAFTLLCGQCGNDRDVPCEVGPDWVLEPTALKETRAAIPPLAQAANQRLAQRFRDDLCGLYVALTRARREQIILAPEKETHNPADRAWLPFRKLAEDTPAANPKAPATCLYEAGAPDWWRAEPDRPAPPQATDAIPWRPAPTPAREETELPSEHARATTVAELLDDPAGPARAYGIAEHARLAAIAWQDNPTRFPEVFLRPDEPCELWRERPFAVTLKTGGRTRRLAGQFDRVHLFPSSRRAVIYDFKTARAPGPPPRHVTQLRDYRQALAALTGYAPADIRTVLLFTSAGRAVEVPGA